MAEVNLMTSSSSGGGGSVTVSGGGIPPSNCKNLRISKSGTSVSLKWKDSGDTLLEDKKLVCSWGGTMIRKKLGSYPTNETDGVLVVGNKVLNQYDETAYVDTISSSEEDWKYAAFPYSKNGMYCYHDKNQFNEAIVYEFYLNPDESNPDLMITYPTGSRNANFEPAAMNFSSGAFDYGDWEDAFFIKNTRPVMVNYDGTVAYELYKPNFNYRADGVTASDVSNANFGGNAMIAFPQVWFKIEMVGTLIHVCVANKQVDENYHCYTHYNRLGELLDEIFIMAFQPANISSKLRSLAGKTILTNNAGTTEITLAQANGDSWGLIDYGEVQMLYLLALLMCKSTNCQAKFGAGRQSGANATTGECISKGMFYGTADNGPLKFFGIENYWGNYWKRCFGCTYTTAEGLKVKLCDYTKDGSTVIGYNTTGEGYNVIQPFSGSSGGYTSEIIMSSKGLFPTVASGSATTKYCDGLWWANGGFAIVGGGSSYGALDGPFCLDLLNAVSNANTVIGGSLSCKPS